MNHGARGVPGARGEAGGGLAAGDLTGRVIGLAIKVHKTVGPGLLEQIYEDCLCHEKTLHGLTVQRQVKLPLIYNGVRLPHAYRTDIVVGETVVLEIKSIERILRVHEAQLLTSAAEQLRGGVAAEFLHQPVERWPPPFRQHRFSCLQFLP
jgi:GxxExxY protein